MLVLLVPPRGKDYRLHVARDLIPHHFGPESLLHNQPESKH